ncbi:FKBP-type peptidyl-prolyl cis-trans isomerase [Spirochaeta africana]|uniref:Peptidyl-prolyl cis-trans isomerase n=1 Tax=Spirochaeta africana (strain ATCC 700263 / DSM 8902 / Z-7692) TaxID=889378 RepID=H9UGI3_SPIAZ|nr:peptidylprolyl isomerase [Spirochaeta africana]AFG36626.1 FKBP-type peptidyl-prolyl cis-trans isomerase [Spirochaeta africana DSM 8902]
MNIAKNSVVTMDYTLKDGDGTVIDTSEGREPLAYLHGAGNIIPGLESALEGKPAGESVQAVIAPADAYGEWDENKVFDLNKEQFSGVESVEPGMQFQAQIQDTPTILTVKEVEGDKVTVDANHPLAGATLHFDVEIREVREASEEEISHGHVH